MEKVKDNELERIGLNQARTLNASQQQLMTGQFPLGRSSKGKDADVNISMPNMGIVKTSLKYCFISNGGNECIN